MVFAMGGSADLSPAMVCPRWTDPFGDVAGLARVRVGAGRPVDVGVVWAAGYRFLPVAWDHGVGAHIRHRL